MQICCNIYIVVAEIQQSKALEWIACQDCFEGSDKKYLKKFLTKGTEWDIIYKLTHTESLQKASEKAVFLEN